MKLGSSNATYPNTKRRYQYCDTCGSLLPAPGYFCALCGPPEPPEPYPEKSLSFSQAFLRIILIILIFIALVMTRLEISLEDLMPVEVNGSAPLKVAEDEDFKLLFKINVSFANLRDQPNTKTSKILFVLTRGTQVEILEKNGDWSKIRSKPEPGEQARTGWLASKLLDSEIK